MTTTCVPRSFVILNNKYPAVVSGYFAGDAWMKSEAAFHSISGRSFGVITFDDMCQYKEDKGNINRPTIKQWHDLTNEQKEVCYKAYNSLDDVVYYEDLEHGENTQQEIDKWAADLSAYEGKKYEWDRLNCEGQNINLYIDGVRIYSNISFERVKKNFVG